MKKVLDEGILTSHYDMQSYPYQMLLIDERYLAELSAFQKTTWEKMADKTLYSPVDDDMIRAVLGEKGLTIALMVRGKLSGFVSFYFPGDAQDNLGRDAGLSEQELQHVVHWERCLIDPEFRGNNMQFRMGELLVPATRELNRNYRYMCATVSPSNYPSLHQLFEQQKMIAVALKIKYGNLWRLVFFQDVINPVQTLHEGIVTVECTDLERQIELFHNGYCAIQVLHGHDGMQLLFAKAANIVGECKHELAVPASVSC